MNPEDFNPRASHLHKGDLVQFLKGLDDSICLPSSINKQGLIKLIDRKLGRATDRVLRQRSNSPALPVAPDTLVLQPSPQPVLEPLTPKSRDESCNLEIVADTKPEMSTHPNSRIAPVGTVTPPKGKNKTIPSSITIDPPRTGSKRVSFTLYPSSLSIQDSDVSEAISRMNVGRTWCILDPVDPMVKPSISRLKLGLEWCYIQQGQAGIVSKANIPTTPESAAAVGSLHYWDPKDDTRYDAFLSSSPPNLLFECNNKLDDWLLVDSSEALSKQFTSPAPPFDDKVQHTSSELPGAFPVDQVVSQLDYYPPIQLLPGNVDL
ncbi:hypothetical protein PGTUg99_015497 [Puccinia graminis f. sp. tritici]|uniref:Uncharacterized protein n=1 Tax=Puccinia graminis f. sp. tritici TaxID=56615 RepID=A0A5B0RYX7_PUCGR|nr:hypothetical protein PGTUg99_015497 [Puccinia graminis f. sp. tritici]